jgi:hypothetical protein
MDLSGSSFLTGAAAAQQASDASVERADVIKARALAAAK